MFEPRFLYTDEMVGRLMTISAARALVDVLPVPELQEWFGVSRSTASTWIHSRHNEEFFEPASGDVRVTAWRTSEDFGTVVASVRKAIDR